MRPLTGALLFIILSYVVVLNGILVNMVYKKYAYLIKPSIITESPNIPNTTVKTKLLEKHTESPCTRAQQLVVLVTQSRNALSNDISKQVTLLTKLRTMLRDKHYEHIHMYLAVDVNTFMPVHRSLCSNIPRCTLLLTAQNEIPEIFEHITKIKPCIADIVMLTDKSTVDPTFLTRVTHTDSTRVTCLLQSNQGQPCPDIAYRIPRSFFTTHRTRAVDIMSTATIEGVAAPPFSAISII